MNSKKLRFMIGLGWLLSFLSAVVLIAGLIKSWPFPNKYSCQVGLILKIKTSLANLLAHQEPYSVVAYFCFSDGRIENNDHLLGRGPVGQNIALIV